MSLVRPHAHDWESQTGKRALFGSAWPTGMIRKLGIVVGGHRFEISAVVLALDAPGAYPILLGRLGYARPT